VLSVLMFALVPIGLMIQFLLWRFYWYLILIGLILQFVCAGLTLSGLVNLGSFAEPESPFGATLSILTSINPLSMLLALFLAALITFILYRIYALWKRPRSGPDGTVNEDLTSDFGPPMTLMDRVVRKLEATGSKAQVEGATVQVYKNGEFVGIVRVIDRPGAITATNVNDVVKLRDRLGVKIAYIATTGHFESQVRDLANQQGIRLMTV
jgi:hypothetical protein